MKTGIDMYDPELLVDFAPDAKLFLVIKLCLFEFEPGLYQGFVAGVEELSDIGPLTEEEKLAWIERIGNYCKRRFPGFRFTWWAMSYKECKRLQQSTGQEYVGPDVVYRV
jgi:hypothetical protein